MLLKIGIRVAGILLIGAIIYEEFYPALSDKLSLDLVELALGAFVSIPLFYVGLFWGIDIWYGAINLSTIAYFLRFYVLNPFSLSLVKYYRASAGDELHILNAAIVGVTCLILHTPYR